MVAMSEGRASALLKKLALRLDDGTVIRGGGGEGEAPAAVVLKPAAAYAAGALTEAHLLKAQALLCEVHAKLPEEGPLRSLSLGSKRSADTAYEVGNATAVRPPPLPPAAAIAKLQLRGAGACRQPAPGLLHA